MGAGGRGGGGRGALEQLRRSFNAKAGKGLPQPGSRPSVEVGWIGGAGAAAGCDAFCVVYFNRFGTFGTPQGKKLTIPASSTRNSGLLAQVVVTLRVEP